MVAESEMPRDRRIPLRIAMKLHAPLSSPPVRESAIAPPRQAIFAVPDIAELLQERPLLVEVREVQRYPEEIKYRLCDDTRNGRRADVVNIPKC